MTFQVAIEKRPNTFGLDERIWILRDGCGSFVEIAPALGFNAYRWHVPDGELLYTDPHYFQENKPTRTGFPILFPFPNRIRAGRFTWAGKEYHLPTNDPSGTNAIHGFTCRKPWRVLDQGADAKSAWVSAEFCAARDAPDTLPYWPADYRVALTYRLGQDCFDVVADLANLGGRDLPWGLGYHPYFSLSLFGGEEAAVTLPANKYWELVDCLPTGRQIPVAAERDLRGSQRYAKLKLDDAFTDLGSALGTGDLRLTGVVSHGRRRLEMYTSPIFREIVAFTPPHRQAICLEPYTCITDAINLQQRGIDAGWQVLKPSAALTARVRLVYRST